MEQTQDALWQRSLDRRRTHCWTPSATRPKRAFFIHPAWARRGIGSKILEACEIAASAAGFASYEMGATLTGAKLFGKKGYVAVENIEVPLKNGLSLPVVRMAKRA
jgi:GNAT superfamily N-acetyltransferase